MKVVNQEDVGYASNSASTPGPKSDKEPYSDAGPDACSEPNPDADPDANADGDVVIPTRV